MEKIKGKSRSKMRRREYLPTGTRSKKTQARLRRGIEGRKSDFEPPRGLGPRFGKNVCQDEFRAAEEGQWGTKGACVGEREACTALGEG